MVKRESVTELTPIETRVIRAVVALKSEIEGGFLATAKITAQVNSGVDQRFSITPESVGKTMAAIGLPSKHLHRGRGFQITEEDVERLESLCKTTVATGATVIKIDRSTACAETPTVAEVAQPSRSAEAA